MASVARYCCCGGCPALEATISGLDAAAALCGCHSSGGALWYGGDNSVQMHASSFDGVYSLIGPTSPDGSGVCSYYTDPSPTWNPSIEFFSDAACASSRGTATSPMRLRVDYNLSTGKVVYAFLFSTGYITPRLQNFNAFLATGISTDLGAAISNQYTSCTWGGFGSLKVITPGGSITVDAV